MMDLTILTTSRNEEWLGHVWSEARSIGRARVVATGSIAEACDLLSCSGARLIALKCSSGAMSQEELDQLLWVNSTLAHPAIVLVIDDGYQADLALTLFRMGVDEYISVPDHAARLATVMRHLLAETPSGAPGVQEPAPARSRPARPAPPADSCWLAAASIS